MAKCTEPSTSPAEQSSEARYRCSTPSNFISKYIAKYPDVALDEITSVNRGFKPMMRLNSFKLISVGVYECSRSDFLATYQAKRRPEISDIDREFSSVVSWGTFEEIKPGLYELVPFMEEAGIDIAATLALSCQSSALGVGMVILAERVLMTRISSRF